MPLAITRGPKVGRCNICGKQRALTSDHVPPKGTNRFNRMQLHSIVDALDAPPGARGRGRPFQGGVKFRSVCLSCNRDVLGNKYDPELVKFSNDVSNYLHSPLDLPEVASFKVKPGSIACAVLGHILAIGIEQFPRTPKLDSAADFVLNPELSIPEGIGIYYWLYPYWEQISIRGCGVIVSWGKPPLVVSVLKFTPLAFMVTWDAESNFRIRFFNLVGSVRTDADSESNIYLNFCAIPRERFPEAPDGSDLGGVLHGRDSYLAERWR